ncbi:HTH-type transcriptional regulator MurR [Sporomusa rhizae]|uniref:MurR/RpiR family transcriptional regulator n=1 Tax=Sporomusa rhizae TaxID=357999 RepID=UPI00352ACE2D
MDILEQISKNISNLSKKQKVVAKYILENWKNIPHQSSVEIAKNLEISQSSVIRTTKTLGFNSFPELQNALHLIIQRQLSFVDRLEQTEVVNPNIETTLLKIRHLQEMNLRQTINASNPKHIRQTIEYIVNARKVYVVGMRSSATLVHYLGFNLNMMTKKIKQITNDYSLLEDIRSLDKQDLLIAISFPRYTQLTKTAVYLAKEQQCPIVAITDCLSSPIAKPADIVLLAASKSLYFNQSLSAAMALCDILLTQLTTDYHQLYRQGMEELEKDYERLNIF